MKQYHKFSNKDDTHISQQQQQKIKKTICLNKGVGHQTLFRTFDQVHHLTPGHSVELRQEQVHTSRM